jgi:hypothetical protein
MVYITLELFKTSQITAKAVFKVMVNHKKS